MVVAKIMGGLGNQMFQYALGRSIALKTAQDLKLDISFFTKQKLRNYELGYFKIDENFTSAREAKLLSGEGLINTVKRRLRIPIKKPKSYFAEDIFGYFYEELLDKTTSIYLDGYWQNERYFRDVKSTLFEDFALKDEISTIAQFYLAEIKSSNSVSLHIRRGDYVTNQHTNSFHGTCGLSYYEEAVRYIEKQVDVPKYFIFSDDIAWCKQNFEFLQDKIFIENTSSIEDLELMKNCKHNIIANSTFSWWGAWLGDFVDKIVIAPKQWFADKNIQNNVGELIPIDWIKI